MFACLREQHYTVIYSSKTSTILDYPYNMIKLLATKWQQRPAIRAAAASAKCRKEKIISLTLVI